MDAVIEMLSAYQEEQARRRRRKLTTETTNVVEERRGQERLEREETYKPLRFPEGPSPGRVKAVLALFQNRRVDDLLQTRLPESDLINSHLLDEKLSETDFKRMLQSAEIWPGSGIIRESENEEETTNKQNKEIVEENKKVSTSDLKVERFF